MDRNQILNDPETAQRYALQGLQSQMWTAMPAIVQSVNLQAMTVECTPAIQGVITDSNGVKSYVTMPPLVDVPICFPSAGGFSLTLPIAIGDEVLAVIANRCIDSWWQSGGIQQPIELRMHDLSDGFAIPGPRSQPRVVPNINTTNAQLRTEDGTCYLEITPDGKINLVAPGGIGVTGDMTVTGSLTVTEEIIGNGIPLSTHLHSGVTPGSGNTGAPLA